MSTPSSKTFMDSFLRLKAKDNLILKILSPVPYALPELFAQPMSQLLSQVSAQPPL